MPSIARVARRRVWSLLAVCFGATLSGAPALAVEEGPLAVLAGSWRGAVAESSFQSAPKEIRAVIEPMRDWMSVRWSTLEGREDELRLEGAVRPGLQAPIAAGSLQGMFGGENTRNPLEGQPLLWGRHDQHGLYIYRLEIARDGGGLVLDRYGFEPGGPAVVRFTAARVGPSGETEGELRAELAREKR